MAIKKFREKCTVLRSLRMPPSLDLDLQEIAYQEERTTSQVMLRFLERAVKDYKTQQEDKQ